MKDRWRLLSVLAVMALVSIACTGDESPQATDGDQGPVTLNLWIFEGEDEFLPTLKREFEKDHPEITVNITHIPEESYVTKIDTALAAGNPPDIGYMYEPRWMKAGRVLPLDDVIASQGIDVSQYNQSAFSYCSLDGHTYCLGSYSGSIMLFYNKELFDAAGVAYPSTTEPMTVDEYAQLAAALTQPNEDRSKYVWGGYADVTTWWLDWRNLFNEDATQVVGYLNDAPTVHLYDVLARMVRDGHSPSESDFDFFGDTDILATGQLAMTITDNVVAIPALEEAGIDWGVAPVPVEQAGDAPWVSSWSDFWGVFAGSENAEAAKEFVAFVGTEGNRLRAETGQQPLDATVADETNWAGNSQGRAQAVEISKLARPVLFLPAGIFSIDGPLWDVFGAIIEGDLTAEQALDEAAPQMQQNLDRAWETWEQI